MRNCIFFIALILSISAYGQKLGKNKKSLCSTILNEVSYFWKIDSLGSNGFRAATVKEILESKLDTISVDFLLNKLGKPNRITKSITDVNYIYYYFNPYEIPKNVGNSSVILYISFERKKDEKFISKIGKWYAE